MRVSTKLMMRYLCLPLVFGLSFIGSVAGAATLSPPTINGSITGVFGNGIPGGGSISLNGLTVSAFYVNGKGSVSASASGAPGTNQANSQLFSAFEVLGPANSNVPLLFSVSGTTSASSGNGQIYAFLGSSVNSPDIFGVTAQSCSVVGQCGPNTPTSFAVNQLFSVASNTVYFVSIDAGGSNLNGGTFSAQVDPSVTFASGFNQPGYSLIYSADTATPVPLPAAAWLFLSGAGLLGILGMKAKLLPTT
jgi:hypothetical protein